jgi:CDP-diacylglycerol---glycerol-3-phosphate 3-phosphatidyltransferase
MPPEAARPSNFNVANALTALRIVLVPVLGWLLLSDGGHDSLRRWEAFAVFLVAILTDRIDGNLARKHNLVTDFGKLMDPIADKALTGMAFIALSVIDELWWWVTIVVLGREWLVTVLRLWVARYGVMAANRGGKLKTVLQATALSGFILPLREFPGALAGVGDVLWWGAVVVMTAAVLVTLTTGADYVRAAFDVRRQGRAAAQSAAQPAP